MLSSNQIDEILGVISNKYGLDLLLILKKPYGAKKGFNGKELLKALLSTSNMQEAAEYLGYSTRDPVKEAIKVYLKNVDKHGGINCNWKNTLMLIAGLHWCHQCNTVKPIEEFGKLNTRNVGVQAACKKCSYINANNRKEHILDRTPSWADKDKINYIYYNCPKGMHVDHIIPLRGTNVSGLHIESNLQYLDIKENQHKHNAFYDANH